MKKRIVSALLMAGLLIGLAGYSYNAQYVQKQEIKHFTAFFSVTGKMLNTQNDIKEMIADEIGADCEENWLVGQSKEEALNSYIASGEYPDFILGEKVLLDADALIPIDEYWDDYPNIRNYLSEEQWERFRQEDGHIYWIPPFCVSQGENVEVTHTGEAFWIQTRVLKWAGYPNDGSCMVDPGNDQVIDYNTTETARRYFQKLNEEYRKGIFDPQSFTSTYEEYLDKLGTGAVLGMVDQWWQFYYNLAEPYETNGLSDLGCDYVPLPITMDKGTSNQWHTSRNAEMDTSSGLSITTSCEDVQGALQFVNDLLDSDITKLRFWGEKDLDYSVDENGMFYMNSEQGKRHGDSVLNESHFCPYSYFPRVEGLLDDGINAFSMEYQPVEFMKSLKPDIRECFEAYGVQNYVELLGTNEAPGAWYPMYSYTQSLSSKSKGGMIRDEIDAVKRSWLPQVIMSDDFASTWDAYMAAYQECNPQDYFDILQRHVDQILQ